MTEAERGRDCAGTCWKTPWLPCSPSLSAASAWPCSEKDHQRMHLAYSSRQADRSLSSGWVGTNKPYATSIHIYVEANCTRDLCYSKHTPMPTQHIRRFSIETVGTNRPCHKHTHTRATCTHRHANIQKFAYCQYPICKHEAWVNINTCTDSAHTNPVSAGQHSMHLCARVHVHARTHACIHTQHTLTTQNTHTHTHTHTCQKSKLVKVFILHDAIFGAHFGCWVQYTEYFSWNSLACIMPTHTHLTLN